jgi:hypothetical protein
MPHKSGVIYRRAEKLCDVYDFRLLRNVEGNARRRQGFVRGYGSSDRRSSTSIAIAGS